MKRFLAKLFPLLLVAALGAENGFAQDNLTASVTADNDMPSRFKIGDDNELLLPVNILGLVNKPGQYMIPFRTDLITLVAYAGGFKEGAKITNVKVVRTFTAKKGGTPQSKIIKVDLKKFFKTGNRKLIPQLLPDDTVVITGTKSRSVAKFFDVFSRAVLVAQFYFYINEAKRN